MMELDNLQPGDLAPYIDVDRNDEIQMEIDNLQAQMDGIEGKLNKIIEMLGHTNAGAISQSLIQNNSDPLTKIRARWAESKKAYTATEYGMAQEQANKHANDMLNYMTRLNIKNPEQYFRSDVEMKEIEEASQTAKKEISEHGI